MILEKKELQGLQSELKYMDEITGGLGFVRGQWEYYRATYDLRIQDQKNDVYFLRVNCRVIDGKMESPYAVLTPEDIYIGQESFPHGVDYNADIPQPVLKVANEKISELEKLLS
ncbi:YugN family protein [Chengkuizengella axinellae]|uniref:YugN family protein n=1 Tax=Chengkuizengella axinellae TaxID=3064388 RepID=A0ABT9IVD9_9BACL|nr:YugN family protein [Chengkuizengella sp. 2205SS18-9]MDP5273331.1 YugN family protein [Chengkuizengella sp. 2205SS18-9]